MKGLDEFLKLFGDITVIQIVEAVLAGTFLIFIYRQIKNYFKAKIEKENERVIAEKSRDEKIQEALDTATASASYKKECLVVQQRLDEILAGMEERLNGLEGRLVEMEESTKRRERNKIRDLLLQNYRYYVNEDTNPTHSWTKMESDTFWELFREYEEAGGNGQMHTEVMPAMEKLTIKDS